MVERSAVGSGQARSCGHIYHVIARDIGQEDLEFKASLGFMRFCLKTTTKAGCGADEMTQGIKMLAAKPDYLALSPWFH